MNAQNFALGPESESAFQTVLSQSVSAGQRDIYLALKGTILSQKRGQVTVQLQLTDGATVGTVLIDCSFITLGTSGSFGGTILGVELNFSPGDGETWFAGALHGSVEFLTGGTLQLMAACPTPSSAGPQDVAIIEEATLVVQ